MLDWARNDYGIEAELNDPMSVSKYVLSSTKTNVSKSSRLIIEDETDFIHKVRNRYFKKRNNDTASYLQAFVRGCLTR